MYDSNLPEAYAAMGLSYFIWGKFDEAAASSRKAIELDPDDFIAYWTLGRIHFSSGEYEQALAQFQRVIDIKPGFYAAYGDLAQTFENLKRTEEANAEEQRLLELLPNYLLQNPDDARARIFYASSLAKVGRKDEAIREGAMATELSPGDPMMLYNCACLYATLREVEQALTALERAVGGGYENFRWMAHDPDLDVLRGEPRFLALIAGR
jgi:tetratricopeptide (TPR) repeat protein